MGGKFDNLAVLEQLYALRIVVTLLKDGPMFKSVLYSKLSKSTNAPQSRVKDLVAAGLIKEKRSRFAPYSITLELTEKGKKVAELVTRIEKLLSS